MLGLHFVWWRHTCMLELHPILYLVSHNILCRCGTFQMTLLPMTKFTSIVIPPYFLINHIPDIETTKYDVFASYLENIMYLAFPRNDK